MGEIWVLLEHDEHALHEYSGELLSEAVELAHQVSEAMTVYALLLTAPGETLPDLTQLAAPGVQQVLLLEHSSLAHYSTAGYVDALTWLTTQRSPLLILASATPNGRDVMPRLAARLHAPFVPNALSLTLHDESLIASRAIYEGRAYVETETPLARRTVLATLIPGIRGATYHTSKATEPVVTRLTPELANDATIARVQRVALQAPSPEEVELDAAERIVAGGRGIGQQGFQELAAFAHQLGAAVGATRVATDLGWIEHERQIGATGKIVRPRLYIACGISGATQHTSGMSESKTVIAINPDRSAPIFAFADLGLLGDANDILPIAAKLVDGTRQRSQLIEHTEQLAEKKD